jgi:hypothetical protein
MTKGPHFELTFWADRKEAIRLVKAAKKIGMAPPLIRRDMSLEPIFDTESEKAGIDPIEVIETAA